jgi:hypothetical protein
MNRELRLHTLDEALEELERLEKGGVATLGIWSYYQILRHLADHIDFSISGFPFVRSRFIREKIGPTLFRQMVSSGHMPAGFRSLTPETTRIEGDAKSEMRRLKSEIQRFMSHTGPFADHPLFGRLTREEWNMLHSYHIANHLGFVIPESLLKQKKRGAKPSSKTGSPKKSAPSRSTKKGTRPIAKKKRARGGD